MNKNGMRFRIMRDSVRVWSA